MLVCESASAAPHARDMDTGPTSMGNASSAFRAHLRTYRRGVRERRRRKDKPGRGDRRSRSVQPGARNVDCRGTERYRCHRWGWPRPRTRRWEPRIMPKGCGGMGAAMHTGQMAGALERCLEQSLRYATDRRQFGRPIAKFQAVQHSLAVFRGRGSRGHHICRRRGIRDFPPRNRRRADVPRGRHREDTGRPRRRALGAGIAHQVHGAIGFTSEDSLQHRTRRLWAWRGEFGPEAVWAIDLGRHIAKE